MTASGGAADEPVRLTGLLKCLKNQTSPNADDDEEDANEDEGSRRTFSAQQLFETGDPGLTDPGGISRLDG